MPHPDGPIEIDASGSVVDHTLDDAAVDFGEPRPPGAPGQDYTA